MSFWEKTRKFLEPLSVSKTYLVLSVFKFCVGSIYALYAVFLLKTATQAIETNTIEYFTAQFWIFIAFVVGYFIFSLVARRWDWPILHHATQE